MLQSLIGPVTGLLDKFIEDKDQKAMLAHELATMADKQANSIALAQIEVNKMEAASGSIFKGGWRPFIGWVCGVAIAYAFVAQPLIEWVVAVNQLDIITPKLNVDTLYQLVLAMLGMATLRTYEKKNQVNREK